jgi:hypothetical protein
MPAVTLHTSAPHRHGIAVDRDLQGRWTAPVRCVNTARRSPAMHVTMTTPEAEVLTRRQAAERLGVTTTTLARWAMQGRGPSYSLTGDRKGRALYSAASIAAWMQERRCTR